MRKFTRTLSCALIAALLLPAAEVLPGLTPGGPAHLAEELEKLAAEVPTPEPTAEERIAALEKDNAELRDALDALISGVTA